MVSHLFQRRASSSAGGVFGGRAQALMEEELG